MAEGRRASLRINGKVTAAAASRFNIRVVRGWFSKGEKYPVPFFPNHPNNPQLRNHRDRTSNLNSGSTASALSSYANCERVAFSCDAWWVSPFVFLEHAWIWSYGLISFLEISYCLVWRNFSFRAFNLMFLVGKMRSLPPWSWWLICRWRKLEA